MTIQYSKKSLILAIVIICFALIISAISFIVFSPKRELFKVEFVKGYNDILVCTYRKGEKISFPEVPSKFGYKFIGWSLEKDEEVFLTQEIVIDKEMTLYAKWEEQMYTLSYKNLNVNISLNSEFNVQEDKLKIVGINETVEITEPNKEGFRFVEWNITDGINVYRLSSFKLEQMHGTNLELVPVLKEIVVSFKIEENEKIKIHNLSHDGKISVKDKLTFDIMLDESINKSEILVSATNGEILVDKLNGIYNVSIYNFNKDFEVSIGNIKTNSYKVFFNNQDEVEEKEFLHGENLILPSLNRNGYNLVGFKDYDGRYYFSDYIVSSDLNLFAVWEEAIYNVELPKTNGMFVINYGGEYLTTSKKISKNYNEILEFEITLSNAYNNSNIVVYATTAHGNIYPRLSNNKYIFDYICCDMQIVVDNVELNSYEVSIDGISYGRFGYGTWLYVDGNNITIKDIVSGGETRVNTIVEDDCFSGWICNETIVVNCIVQDIADKNSKIDIKGSYSKKVARIRLVPNGGSIEELEIVIVEGEDYSLPSPTRYGYKFVGWFTKLVEVNTIVDESLSTKFEEITDVFIVLYAGWTK